MIAHVGYYYCPDTEAHWVIERADGELEVHTVLNESYSYGRYEQLPNKELFFYSYCNPLLFCGLYLDISPTDLRYNGAQITGVFHLPECFNIPNVTDTTTLNLQGIRKGTILAMCYNNVSFSQGKYLTCLSHSSACPVGYGIV